MNKELTPLEVSNQLKEFILEFVNNGLDRMFVQGSFDIIETALKALATIRKKNINVHGIINSPTLEYYIEHCMPRHSEEPTQEEYDSLKEVLLCKE